MENDGGVITDRDGREYLNLCGVIDLSAYRIGLPKSNPDEALKNARPDLPTVFMTHQPKIAGELTQKVDLTLAGHTHGGLMPGLKQIVAAANGGYVSGYYNIGREKLIVSNGTRIWAGAPLRLNDPAEISIITLTRQQ